MANIVLGLTTSHTPLFTLNSDDWRLRAEPDRADPRLNLSDGRRMRYEELLAEVGPKYAEASRQEELVRKAALCEAALDRLANALEAARPDLVLVVGDDQGELFSPSNQPAIAICHNQTLITSDIFGREGSPDWVLKAGNGYLINARHALPGHAAYALSLIHGLVDHGVDVTAVADSGQDVKAGLGHAFGFIVQRLFRGRCHPDGADLAQHVFPAECADCSPLP